MWSTCPASSTQRIPSPAVDYRHPPDPVARRLSRTPAHLRRHPMWLAWRRPRRRYGKGTGRPVRGPSRRSTAHGYSSLQVNAPGHPPISARAALSRPGVRGLMDAGGAHRPLLRPHLQGCCGILGRDGGSSWAAGGPVGRSTGGRRLSPALWLTLSTRSGRGGSPVRPRRGQSPPSHYPRMS